MTDSQPLMELRDLVVTYQSRFRRRTAPAVNGVSFSVATGETVGLVGESGSGKSSIGNAILGLSPIESGRVIWKSADITEARPHSKGSRRDGIQPIFQDPFGSLSPTRTVAQSVAEPILASSSVAKDDLEALIRRGLEQVGLPPDTAGRYPSELSGGQRQRISIARALMRSPQLMICDEPTSALDVSVQAQILNLLLDLQGKQNLSYLFISHNIAAVRHVAHRMVVIYGGRVMESGPTETVYQNPAHPYTKTLIDAVPVLDPEEQKKRRQMARSGELIDGITGRAAVGPAASGCPFASRCPYQKDVCLEVRPVLRSRSTGIGLVACHRAEELQGVELPAG